MPAYAPPFVPPTPPSLDGAKSGSGIGSGLSHSELQRKREMAKMRSTTSTPSTTATTLPPPHEHIYERTISQGRISDHDIGALKNLIRIAHGLRVPPTPPRRKRSHLVACAPRIQPKPNGTSRMRMECRAYRLRQRCQATAAVDALHRQSTGDASAQRWGLSAAECKRRQQQQQKLRSSCGRRSGGDKEHDDELELKAKLRWAKQLNAEQLERREERCQLERLRDLALSAAKEEVIAVRHNICSTYRYRRSRGDPIITSRFRETFVDYMRPPFENAVRRLRLPKRLPPIDKANEIWLWTVTDDAKATPLHRLTKEERELAAKKRRRGEKTQSSRVLARPPLRRHVRTRRQAQPLTMATADGRRKKIPWNYGAVHAPLLVKVRDNLMRDEQQAEEQRRQDGKQQLRQQQQQRQYDQEQDQQQQQQEQQQKKKKQRKQSQDELEILTVEPARAYS